MNIPHITECFSSFFCDVHRRSFVFSALNHSPYPRMIWILTTIPILLRRLQWWIAVALLLFEGTQRVSPFYHEFLLPKWRACVHERNVIETCVSLPKRRQRVSPFYPASVLGTPHRLITVRLSRRTPGVNTFQSACGPTTTSFTDPPASRNTFSVSTITDGNARIGGRSTFPALTLAWLYRPVTQSIATPEPSSRTISTPDRTLVARQSLECVTTPGSRRSCPGWAAAHLTWMLTVFTSLACYLGALPGQVGPVGSPYHVAATYPCGQPVLCVSLEVFATPTRRYHGRMLIHHSTPCEWKSVCTHAGSGPLRVRRRLSAACLGDSISLATADSIVTDMDILHNIECFSLL